MIAALFVETGGCYFGLDGVDPWDRQRDARNYDGLWPVVAHPPCERWGRFAKGSPLNPIHTPGDDGGCFEAALAAVRKWGGVLEHPEGSLAFRRFDLPIPSPGAGWISSGMFDPWRGWSCYVEQGFYGHNARKRTWLYACGTDLPSLRFGKAPGSFMWIGNPSNSRAKGRVIIQLPRRERAATPIEFRDVLLGIARSAIRSEVAA